MKRTGYVLALMMILVSWVDVFADRMTDRDLAALFNRIDDGRDQFEGALDGKVKDSVLRSPSGETDVSKYLDDFQTNIDRMKERMGKDYAASTEAGVVLRQATAIDTFFRSQPPGTRGESEWNRLSGDLRTLAGAYGVTFPLAEGANARRLSRRELVGLSNDAARSADAFKKALDNDLKKDPSVTKDAREAIVREADNLKKDAEAVKSRVDDDQPSSGEVDRFFDRANKLQGFLAERRGSPMTASSAWTTMAPGLQTLAGAYGASGLAAR